MAEITQKWLELNVGEPSNNRGSTYSKIYKLTGEIERLRGVDKLYKSKIEELYILINEWSKSSHRGARTADEKTLKDNQQRQMTMFQRDLKVAYFGVGNAEKEEILIRLDKAAKNYEKEQKLVSSEIAKMAESSDQLIRNTGAGLMRMDVLVVPSDDESGQWNNHSNVISVNPVLAYNRRALTGVLVHEYHHCLNRAPIQYGYLDEFGAHMKQFSITHPKVDEPTAVAYINRHLETFYPSFFEKWQKPETVNESFTMGKQLVERFSDLGNFLIPDNGDARAPSALQHNCQPVSAVPKD